MFSLQKRSREHILNYDDHRNTSMNSGIFTATQTNPSLPAESKNTEINSSTQPNSSLPHENENDHEEHVHGSRDQENDAPERSDVTNIQMNSLDINNYCGREINDRMKERLIQNKIPDISYQLPIRKYINKRAKERTINSLNL